MTGRLPEIGRERGNAVLAAIATQHLLVVGDVMLDQFTIGRVARISPEAPVPVVAFERDEFRAGGAANVAANVRAMGASVDLLGLVGSDVAAERLRELLTVATVPVNGLITDDTRRTTTKTRIVTTRNQQVARVDYESDKALSDALENTLIDQIDSRVSGAGAVIVSDYLKGLVTRRLMVAIVAAAERHEIPVFVDPKVPHLSFYAGATVVTPNQAEAELATDVRIRSDADAQRAGAIFRERARCEGVLLTRGEDGMWLDCGGVQGALPAVAQEVSDVTGAGDTVVAVFALALAAKATPAEAAQLANRAAGIVVAKFGPATATPAQIRSAGFGSADEQGGRGL